MVPKIVSIYFFSLLFLTPYIGIGKYGITLLEIVAFLFLIILPLINDGKLIKTPNILTGFFILYTLGFIGATINSALNWAIPISVSNLNFFYKIIIGLSSYNLGVYFITYFQEKKIDIFSNLVVKITIFLIFVMVMTWPFLNYDLRIKIYQNFFPQGGLDGLQSLRFPGPGINNNSYSFFINVLFVLSLNSWINKRCKFYIPFFLLLIILALASKLAAGSALMALIFLLVIELKGNGYILKKRPLILLSAIALLTTCLIYIISISEFGEKISESFTLLSRIDALTSNNKNIDPSGAAERYEVWKLGIERVELSPILGIVKNPSVPDSESNIVNFGNPHNEWIRIWMFFGFFGLSSWIILIGYFIWFNLKSRNFYFFTIWFLFVFFMMYDGGIDNPRFVVFLFFIFGMNFKYKILNYEKKLQ
jgi:hypothetical protein